jgi:hypothetical protein
MSPHCGMGSASQVSPRGAHLAWGFPTRPRPIRSGHGPDSIRRGLKPGTYHGSNPLMRVAITQRTHRTLQGTHQAPSQRLHPCLGVDRARGRLPERHGTAGTSNEHELAAVMHCARPPSAGSTHRPGTATRQQHGLAPQARTKGWRYTTVSRAVAGTPRQER